MQTNISLNTVNRERINMNLKYEKRGMSPGIFFSILSDIEDRVIGTLKTITYSIKQELFSSATKG